MQAILLARCKLLIVFFIIIFVSDMAQAMFQMPGLWDDPQHADVQGFQQTAVLRGVSVAGAFSIVLH